MHSLATMLACDGNAAEPNLFPLLSQRPVVSSYINTILQKAETKLVQDNVKVTPKLKTHSGRRGAAVEANAHKDVQTIDVINRGNWAMDGYNKVFTYLVGNQKTDTRVSRALGLWDDANQGALMPLPNQLFDSIEMEKYCLFVSDLYLSKSPYDSHLNDLLTMAIFRFHCELKEKNLKLAIVQIATEIAIRYSIPLDEWSFRVREGFNRINLLFEEMSTEETMSLKSLRKVFEKVEIVARVIPTLQQKMMTQETEIKSIKHQLHQIEINQRDMMKNQVEMLRLLSNSNNTSRLKPNADIQTPEDVMFSEEVDDNKLEDHRLVNDMQNKKKLPIKYSSKLVNGERHTPKVKINSVYNDFYADGLYDKRPNNVNEIRVWRDMRKMVDFMNRFLPPGTIITRMPATLLDKISYCQQLGQRSIKLEAAVMSYLQTDDVEKLWRSVAPKEGKRTREFTPLFTGILKK